MPPSERWALQKSSYAFRVLIFFPLNYALMHPALQDTAATTAGQRNNVLQPSQEHHTHAG